MRLQQYLNEARRPGKFIVTIKDIERLDRRNAFSREAKFTVDMLLDFWYDEDKTKRKDVSYFLQMFSKAGTKALKMLGDVPYYDRDTIIKQLLDRMELPESMDDLFPIPIYISSGQQDRATVGIMVHKNGKKELFEGNDEATEETYDLVDEILGNIKPVTVYAQHGQKTVEKIKRTNTLPKDLYVSPSKKYAEGYWSLEEDRVMFSCEAMSNAFRKESEVDWKTKKVTKIKRFKYI
jgi:hypothetical protein